MNKYKYFGKISVNLIGYGKVSPKEIIETEQVISHPLFKPYKEVVKVEEVNSKKYKRKGK